MDPMIRRPANEGHKQLLRELNEERAAALQRISGTLESLIRQLHASRDRMRKATGSDREREVATWRDLRARAAKYRWYLEVQREALGMRRHDVLDEFYQVPTFDGREGESPPTWKMAGSTEHDPACDAGLLKKAPGYRGRS